MVGHRRARPPTATESRGRGETGPTTPTTGGEHERNDAGAASESADDVLGAPLTLPCGVVLKNRLAKAAMSDSLGDGRGSPTDEQVHLYRRWARGGVAVSVIGEVQIDPEYAERPGNLVLGPGTSGDALGRLARAGSVDGAALWPQLGHAGALAHRPIASPAGPSALSVGDLTCDGLSTEYIQTLPERYAAAARHAARAGFTGVEIHAAHGFLLGQFLSPLFNHRDDRYGGSVEARSAVLREVVRAVRREVGAGFAIAVKINSSDELEGGLTEEDALATIGLLDEEELDLVDISGGTYVPGAASSSDRSAAGPYFLDFARRARDVTTVPLMLTGGIKTRSQAADVVASGAADVVGLARALVLDPELPTRWLGDAAADPDFPRFRTAPPGGVTAWYTIRLTALAEDREAESDLDPATAVDLFEARDARRTLTWNEHFERAVDS